jgi:hypothetical protein
MKVSSAENGGPRWLAAEALGLGSTVTGGAPPILQRNRRLCARLGIPPANTPSITLVLGHPVTKSHRAVRRYFTHVNTVR